MRHVLRLLAICLVAIPLTASAQNATPITDEEPLPGAVLDPHIYCETQDGVVRERYPVFGTNDPSTQIQLAGSKLFCEFTGGEGADPPDSWISIDLDSLMAVTPTLATLAYLTKPPIPEMPNPNVNPASIYCSHLGGAEIGAVTGAAGGGWVTDDTDTYIDVLQACVFPDGSIIDSWGITYHADGTIRGADLAPIIQYQPEGEPPHVFPGAERG